VVQSSLSETKAEMSRVNFCHDVIYQIITDRFYNGNPLNNPTGDLFDHTKKNLKKYFGGDWRGITQKMNEDYFKELSVTVLWLSPPVENIYEILNDAEGSTSYHGYWARDFKKPNPFFGDLIDFKTLVETAHSQGIKVVIDFAPNHTSPASHSNPYYAENGILFDDGKLVGSYSNDVNGYFHHHGGTDFIEYEDGIYRNLYDLADLNHQHSKIDYYFKEAIKLWLDLGIDGIRVDAVKHMSLGWQKNWLDEIYRYKPVFVFGEWYLKPNERDPRNIEFANNAGMSVLDFSFAQKVREVFRDHTDDMFGLDEMIQETKKDYERIHELVTFIDNHDMDRFHIEGGRTRLVDQALAFLLTSRGVPSVYYGTEHYMAGNGDPNNRAQMPSFKINTTASRVIQKLSSLRKTNAAIAYGNTVKRHVNKDVYIYERTFGEDVVIVALNRSLTKEYKVKKIKTALKPGQYEDVLEGILDGRRVSVSTSGHISQLKLSPGEVSIWMYKTTETPPLIGHVGPRMVQTGQVIRISGSGFLADQGDVLIGKTKAEIVSWADHYVEARIPNMKANKYKVTLITKEKGKSNVYKPLEVLSGNQVCVRFIVENGYSSYQDELYIIGNVFELGNKQVSKAKGPFFNQVIYQFPTGYLDINVPANTTMEFKLLRKNKDHVLLEEGDYHVFTSPSIGTAEVKVKWAVTQQELVSV